ncbi:MAG: alpha-L-rhamnosidase, partial [Planctomycetes bacterium]|nr:alpha-L-rhamnosidase [Planctomycetota bacterium]
YELWIDGARCGRGPERGDRTIWHFETYDLELAAGEHLLTARTWWLGMDATSPYAQVTIRPGFVCAAEDLEPGVVNTGFAPWQVKRLDGYGWVPAEMTWATGVKVALDAARFPWGWQRGDGDGWATPHTLTWAGNEHEVVDHDLRWYLRPAELPAMRDEPCAPGRIRHLAAIPSLAVRDLAVDPAAHRVEEAASWQAMLTSGAPAQVPAHALRRVIVDLDDYVCGYLELDVRGGAGAELQVNWAESLYDQPGYRGVKGHRDQVDGKFFYGTGDRFRLDGEARTLAGLWWQAGRFLEILVATGDQDLEVRAVRLRRTGYPLVQRGAFACSDPRHERLRPLLWRTLEACAHETFIDCPYYEQLQYVADTRIEALATYAVSGDGRLARKAIAAFQRSQLPNGLLQSRWPHERRQILSTFSLWWIGMLHDRAWWSDDRGFVREQLATMRTVLDHFLRHVGDDGLLESPRGWAFIDWCPEWTHAVPPGGEQGGRSAVFAWLLVWMLRLAAELEDACGEPECAALWRRRGAELAAATDAAFWDESRALYADDRARSGWSEHAQILALLSHGVPAQRVERLRAGLLDAQGLVRSTWFFAHYLCEALAEAGRVDRLLATIEPWLGLPDQGFLTVPERPEPSRSDCHAWSAHPLYQLNVNVLGIRPGSPGFASVDLRPDLGGLTWARGSVPHRLGPISVELERGADGVACTVTVPDGLVGRIAVGSGWRTLPPGHSHFVL